MPQARKEQEDFCIHSLWLSEYYFFVEGKFFFVLKKKQTTVHSQWCLDRGPGKKRSLEGGD